MAAALIINEEDASKVDVLADHFLPLLVREMNRKSSKEFTEGFTTEEMYSISMEVGEVFKTKLGDQRYASQLAECQKTAIIKAELRKRKAKGTPRNMPSDDSPAQAKLEVHAGGIGPGFQELARCIVLTKAPIQAEELVLTNPDEAAALKRKKNVKKTESRKRKIDALKPYRVINRQHAERVRAEQNEED
ncbi:hypothetical protein COOONC_23978 [Cooperia oncophora]